MSREAPRSEEEALQRVKEEDEALDARAGLWQKSPRELKDRMVESAAEDVRKILTRIDKLLEMLESLGNYVIGGLWIVIVLLAVILWRLW